MPLVPTGFSCLSVPTKVHGATSVNAEANAAAKSCNILRHDVWKRGQNTATTAQKSLLTGLNTATGGVVGRCLTTRQSANQHLLRSSGRLFLRLLAA